MKTIINCFSLEQKIQKGLLSPKPRKRTKEQLESLIQKLLKGQFMEGLITYQLEERGSGRWSVTYQICKDQLAELDVRLVSHSDD